MVYEDPRGKLLATDPRFQGDVETSVAGLRSVPAVADVISPAQSPRQLAPDGHAAYVVVTLAAMVGLSKVSDLSIFSLNLATLLGLGLGIDYSLFIVSRFREELGHGKSVEEAIAGSISTAGRAVVVSGITVAAGLLGLLVFQFNALWSLGVAGALVVCASVLAALTLLPALLGLLGSRIDALSFHLPFRPFRRSDAAASVPGSGFWSRLARAVMAQPIRTILPLVGVLIGLGLLHHNP